MKQSLRSNYFPYVALPLIALITFGVAQNNVVVIVFSLLLLTGLLAWIIDTLNLQVVLLKTIAFTLPFSLEVSFIADSMIRIPGELLLLVGTWVLVFEVIRQPLRELAHPIYREFLWVMPLVSAFLITLPFSEKLWVSVKFSLVNVLYISVFFLLFARHFRKNGMLFGQLLLLYGAGFFIVGVWGLYQLWQWEFNPVVMRGIFQPFYNDHTIFGASAALLTAVFFVLVFAKSSLPGRFGPGLLSIVFLFLVLFSTSRGAILSVFFMLLVLSLWVVRVRFKHLIFLLIVFLVVGWVNKDRIENRFSRVSALSYDVQAGFLERKESVANITTDVSNLERLNRWVSALHMFKERPLTGFGPGTYQFTYIPFQQPELMNRISVTNPWDIPEGSGGTAHSEYLLALSEMGIWGILGWLVLLGRWFYIAFEKSHKHPHRWVMLAAFAGLSTYIFHANFNNFLTTDKFAFLFWGTAAWLIANLYETQNKPGILQED